MLASLLVTQALGLMHRAAHGNGVVATSAALGIASPAVFEPIVALFDHHDTDSDCRLFDQVSHTDMAGFEHQAMPLATPVEGPAIVHPAWHIACQAVGALARGPPALG